MPKNSRMIFETKEFYNSPNGDRWLLGWETDSVRVFIRHVPNPHLAAKRAILN